MKPPRGYETLRRYRTNIDGASYFVTICTRDRLSGLNDSRPAEAIVAELSSMAADGAMAPRAWVIMPDHLHLFLRTNGTLTIGQIIGRLKAKTRRALGSRGLGWQGNYYEHRLRSGDAAEDVLRYLYLNPHRGGLVAVGESYRYFWLGTAEGEWFRAMLDDNRPLPEWLA
jgi:REP element-mobilizing transposase RayT